MKQKWKRPLALLLSVAMMFSMSGTPVYAADMETGASAVCPHHVHDETCGYSEGTPCTHEHTDDCYTLVTQCVHEHTAECYSDGILPAEGEEKAADACTHVCSEESGCITKELNCPHVHDETCGYSEGSPCTFDPSDCKLCNPTDSGEPEAPAECTCEPLCTADSVNPDCPVCSAEGADLTACAGTVEEGDAAEETDPAQNPAEQTILSWEWIGADNLNEGVLALPGVSAENPVDLATVVSLLPTGITATVDGSEEPVELTITWACEDFVSPATGGTYTFAAALPQSYTLSEETAALTVPVILGGDLLPVDTLATASWYGLSVADTSISGGGYWLNDSSTGGITNNGASASNYNVHFDANTNTLTLNNANLTKASMQGAIIVVFPINTTDFTINLIGDNVLESSNIYGIYTKSTNMTITGSGSLTVSGSQYGIAEFDEQPANSTFTFTIAGGTVTATGGIAGTRLAGGSYIHNTLLLTGGSLTAEGGKYGIHMRGIHPEEEKTITVSSGGSLVASGDTYGIYFDAESSGDPAWRINVNSGGSLVTNSTSVTPTGSGGWLLYGGNTPTVNGTVALPMDLTISKGTALSIAKGSNFIIPDGVVLTNYGTIGNQGTISGNGQIINYGGINSFNGGTNNVANTVNRSVMTVTSKPNTRNIPYGISVTFTAALSRTDAGGKVRFKLDGEIVTEAVVSNGKASITLEGLEKGSHTVTAEYTGDGTYASETGSYQFQIVDGYTITMKTNGVGSIQPNDNTIQPVAENKYAYAAGERVNLRTNAPMGYEISYVTVETEDGRVITPNIVLSQVFFTMPAENVTVYAHFAAEADVSAVNGAYSWIEFSVMRDLKISQEGLATQDEEAIEAWLEARMNSTVKDDTVTCTAEVTSFTPAVAGTPNNPAGTNGSFSVDWSVRKGDAMKSGTSEGTITPAVFQAEISGIEIKTQPTKMDYSFGETLDLSGLVITVLYEGTDDTKEVAWSADSGITADPANGTALYASQHNGKPVTITYEGKTATTSALTVGKADQTGFAFTGEPYRAVACGDEPFAVEATGGQGNGTVTYAVTEGQDVVSVSVSTVTILKSGTATITATKAADEDYNEATATLVVYVTPKQVDGVYQIGTANDLFWFAGLVNGTLENVKQDTAASAVLTADIDLSGETWTPIGNYDQSSRPNNKYAGTFDGAGHTIEGLKIESSADWQGFVGYLGEGGVIENLTLGKTCSVTGGDYVGGICGYTNGGTIESCTNAGTVTGQSDVGGICGLSRGTVTGCTNEGTVTGSGIWVGGVCGLSRGTVTGCTNKGTVSGNNNVGGVCGTNTGGTTENCANFGAVNGSGEWVGGVCGGNTGAITGCTNSGAVTGNGENVGGIVGYTEDGAVENCQNSGSVTGGKYTGAICGWNNAGTITGCTNEGAVNGSGDLGGICGHNEGTVKNCTNSGAVNNGDKNTVGGICGYSKTDVTGCTNSGAVTGKTYVGGIVGYTDDGAVETCQNSGSITGNGEDVGGICGFSNQPITNCANTGDITGGSVVGGVCGLMVSSKVTISNCYNTGTVTGSAVGAVYGKNGRGQSGDGQGTITNCYYQSEETTSTQEGATPKTADQFSSGEVCWLLNGPTSEGTLAWYQNLDNDQDKDTYPVLDSSHGIVYRIEEDPVRYSNDPDGEPAQAISVDITWGELSFTYSDGTWNPDTHEYDGAGWNVDEEGGNSIKVENTGNTDVNVTYDYKVVENGITGSFTDGENPVSAPVSLPENGSSTVYLILAGKPEQKNLDHAKIGSVTVTIGGESE